MANVQKKDGGQGQQQGQQGERGELVRRDPFLQMMMRDPFQMLMRDPFQTMREMMRDMFIDPYRMTRGMGAGREMFSVTFDVRETDDAFIFKADMPGIRTEDIDITLSGNQLQITGNRQHEEEQQEGQMHTYERSYGSFARSFMLPDSADVDKIRSDLKDGVLTLVVPKKPGTSPQKRKIQIGAGSKA